MIPEMSVAAEIDGKMVGASFGMPDYNPRIKEIDGRLFPFGAIKLLRNKRAMKKIRLISTNVLPEYQMYGIGLTLMYGLMPRAMKWGLEEAEFSWVLESNSLSYGSLKKAAQRSPKRTGCSISSGSKRREGRGERGERNKMRSLIALFLFQRHPNHSPYRQRRLKSAKYARPPICGDSSGFRGGFTKAIRIGFRRLSAR